MEEAYDERMNEEYDIAMQAPCSKKMDRNDLIRLLCAHDEYVRRKAYRMIGHKADAEDVAQNAMIDAYRGIENIREPEKIKGWLNTIIRNEAKKLYATNSKYRNLINKLKMESGISDFEDMPEYVAAEIAFRDMMRKAEEKGLAKEIMDSLDPVNRGIMDMKFWDGCKFAEISDVTGLNINTARSTYIRCRNRLYEKYKDIGKEAGLDVKGKE